MTYTVKMEIFFDSDEIMSEKQMAEALDALARSANVIIDDVKILDVNG